MAIGRITDNHLEGFKKDLNELSSNKEEFFKWFAASGQTIDEMFISGAFDFSVHILNPILPLIKDSNSKTILEIGYGGGRILKAASTYFKNAIGIDIHEQNQMVQHELEIRGATNIELFVSKGSSIPLSNNSVDVIYSFIVFQHIQYIDVFESYLKEIHRTLKPNGIAVIYFGRFYSKSLNSSSKFKLWADFLIEKIRKPDYQEINARVNETNLRVSYHYAKKIAEKTGFDVLKRLVSFRGVPNGYGLYGGQNGFVLKKK